MLKKSIVIAARTGLAVAALAALAACGTVGFPSPQPGEGIGFRETRSNELAATTDYRKCRDDGMALADQARQSAASARYLASARMLESCEAKLGASANMVSKDDRMKAYALSIQNYFKGGDIASARTNLSRYKAAFSGEDLYFADGSSFTDTMELLLALRDRDNVALISTANVSESLREELRRVRYWQNN